MDYLGRSALYEPMAALKWYLQLGQAIVCSVSWLLEWVDSCSSPFA